jgi:hypothetical protein
MVPYRDAEGDRCQETFDRKKDADARQAEIKIDIRAGTHVAPSKSPTVAGLRAHRTDDQSAGGVETADWYAFTKLVEAHHSSLSLKDLRLDAVLGQNVQGFGTDLQPFPDASRKHHGLCAVLDQFLNVNGLNARHMACSRLAPVPLPGAAGKNLGVLEGRMAFDLYVAPRKA